MASIQNITVETLLSTLGLYGYRNITAAANGDDHTQLDIGTGEDPAWAVLQDGILLRGELIAASVTGLTVDDSYTLYLDYADTQEGRAAVWTVATSAPSDRAIPVAGVVVSSNTISSVNMVHEGFNGPALEAINIVSTDD